jgi:uncharacterized protein Usg
MIFDFNIESSIPSFTFIVNRYCAKDYYIAPTVPDFHNFMVTIVQKLTLCMPLELTSI